MPAQVDMLFIVDPLDVLNAAHDSTVALMEAAQLAGHRVYVTSVAELSVRADRAVAWAHSVTVRPAVLSGGEWIADPDWYTITSSGTVELDAMAAIFMRTDPPVDAAYLRATYILDLVNPARTLLVNAPAGLRDANEKMFALHFPTLTPPTMVTADRSAIVDTVRLWGKAVLKPTEGMAGRGIMLLTPEDPNLHSILDSATERGRDHVVVQQYLPAVDHGDRRVIVLDGEPIGAVCRLASGSEFRCNMAAGARVAADTVTDRDREICRVLAPEFRRRGLHFVGIDVIGGMLTEINVTSPTGLREIDALSNSHLAADVIDWVGATTAARIFAS